MLTNAAWNLLAAPWTTHVVFAAVRLRVFTVLSDRTMKAREIASQCGAVPRLLEALLDACVSMGLLVSRDKEYANSHFSSVHLVEGEPRYVGDLIELQYAESEKWRRLTDMITGRDIGTVDDDARGPDYYRTFLKAMNNLGMLGEAEALRNALDLSGCREMVDAGGGSGLYSIVLCRAYPELRSTVLDRCDALVVARDMIGDCQERERITLREADITKDSFGKDVDVVLLSDVIYDESMAARVLRNAQASLRRNGTLVIRGYYSDPERSRPLFGALFALGQLAFDPNRRVLTVQSLRKHVENMGFRITRLSPLTERSSILIAAK